MIRGIRAALDYYERTRVTDATAERPTALALPPRRALSLAAAAKAYARHGFFVFPLQTGSKIPIRGSRGLLDATNDVPTVIALWEASPNANIGVDCGRSGLVVIDVDVKNNAKGSETFMQLVAQHGIEAFDTVTARTPSGGRHYFYRGETTSGANVYGPGIDVRSRGGYIVVAPSRTPAGTYHWVSDGNGERQTIAPFPPAMVPQERPRIELTEETAVIMGVRNQTLASVAGKMRRQGFTAREIVAALRVFNAERCRPPLPDVEVDGIARSIGRYAPSSDIQPSQNGKIAADWTFESAFDIHHGDVPAVEFDIETLMTHEDVVHFYAPPGSLKSMLAIHAAACAVTGDPFLGHFKVRKRPYAVYINLDAGRQATRRRIKRAVRGLHNFYLTSPEGFNAGQLRKTFERFPGCFFVIDCWADIYTSVRGEEPGETMRRFIRDLRALCEKYDCNGIVVDHPRRPQKGESESTVSYYGSVQKEAAFRTMWSATRVASTNPAIAKVKIACRKPGEMEPFVPFVATVAFGPDRIEFSLDAILREGAAVPTMPSDAEIVVNLLRGVSSGMSRPEIQSHLGWGKTKVLEALLEAGISAVGRGKSARYFHPSDTLLESSADEDDLVDDCAADPNRIVRIVQTSTVMDETDESTNDSSGSESSVAADESADDPSQALTPAEEREFDRLFDGGPADTT